MENQNDEKNEIDKILTKYKIKDSTKKSLLKDILSKGISVIDTSDIPPKKKTNLKEELSSNKILKKHFTPNKEIATLNNAIIIDILKDIEVQDEDNLFQKISRSILGKGINGFKEFEEDLSESELKNLKKRLEGFFSNESNKSDSHEVINIDLSPMSIDEYEDTLKKSQQIYLNHLREDYLSMPESAERMIMELIVQTNLLLNSSLKSDEKIIEGNEMGKKLEILRERLKLEEFSRALIDKVDFNNENWEELLKKLTTILKEIRPLNVREIERLVKETEKCAEMIKDEDILLFMGETGSGKSTHIHFLAGSKMIETKTIEGLYHIMPTNIKNQALNKVSTSPSAKSETRFISAVPIKISDMKGEYDEKIVLCDTPGFGDTNGAEVDIANGYGVVKALKGCKSVRIVVLISNNSIGDRLTGVKDMAHIMIKMVSGLKNHMKAVSYFFTKFPEQKAKTINAILKNLKDTMTPEEKSDQSFKLFIEDMIKKTRDNKQISINLIKDKPGKYLDDLWELSSICQPDEVFQVSVNEKSTGILKGLFSLLFIK